MSTATSTEPRIARPSSASAPALLRAGIGGLWQAWIWFLFALAGLGVVYYVLYSVAGLEQDSDGTMAVVPDVVIWVWAIILFVWGITQTTLQTPVYTTAGATRRTQIAVNWMFVGVTIVAALAFGALLILVSQALAASWSGYPYKVLTAPWLELAVSPLPMLTAFGGGVLTGVFFRSRSWWVAILVSGIPWMIVITLMTWANYVGQTGQLGVDLTFGATYDRGFGDVLDPDLVTAGPLVIWPVVVLALAGVALIAVSVVAQRRMEIRKAS